MPIGSILSNRFRIAVISLCRLRMKYRPPDSMTRNETSLPVVTSGAFESSKPPEVSMRIRLGGRTTALGAVFSDQNTTTKFIALCQRSWTLRTGNEARYSQVVVVLIQFVLRLVRHYIQPHLTVGQ